MTLAIDATLLEKARIIAIRRRTSVPKLVREHLENLVRSDERAEAARSRLAKLMAKPILDAGDITWSRDDLHRR